MRERTKTAAGRRSIALDGYTVGVLKEHRKRQLEERLAWGEAYKKTDVVFTAENGGPLNPDTLSRTFNRHVTRLGLPRIPLKNLRHTHATIGLEAGINPKVMQERLGHSSVQITMDTYSHVTAPIEEEAADLIEALVHPAIRR